MSDACTNCGQKFKTGLLSANQPLLESEIRIIRLADASNPNLASVFCTSCGGDLLSTAKTKLTAESGRIKSLLKAILSRIPIVSLQHPAGWTYEPITIVTAQTVTGTGLFSDVASAFTDLFGNQSGTYNAKLREGENLCKTSLRSQAIELGGNAVIAVDVDYAEVGGSRAMLMVCMTGTVIKITELLKPDPEFFENTEGGFELAKRARSIESALRASHY